MKNAGVSFLKKETVFTIATVLAIISMFFVKPSIKYFDYINYKTLITLFFLMLIVQFFSNLGVFDYIIAHLLNLIKTTRSLVFVLVYICFFSSCLITNDVALITFVPFAMITLKKIDKEKLMIKTIILQTLAANLGSMMTPIGNPQNIYLYSLSGLSVLKFIKIMLPFALASFILLTICILLIKSEKIRVTESNNVSLCTNNLLSKTFKGVDYFLLLTFVSFFILIGNLQNIDLIKSFFEKTINGHEMITSVLASQIVSNVPAAILLSGFTSNYKELLIGVNLGGLGTLIASMASLISYKIYAHNYNETKGKYLLEFTVVNVIYLAVLIGIYYVI